MLPHPAVVNALIRCARSDKKAAPTFQPAEHLPGVWVLELAPKERQAWPEWRKQALSTLKKHKRKLIALAADSKDYTLHIAVDLTEPYHAATLSPELCGFAAECGFAIEIVHSSF